MEKFFDGGVLITKTGLPDPPPNIIQHWRISVLRRETHLGRPKRRPICSGRRVLRDPVRLEEIV